MAFGDGSVTWSDTFTYSDGSLSTVGSTEWTNGYWSGQASLDVSSGVVVGNNSSWQDNYTNDSFTVGSGFDFIARSVSKAGTGTSTFFHVLGTPAGSPSGYFISILTASGTDSLRFGTITSGSFTNLINVTQEWTNGDDFGCRIESDGTCSLWYKPAAGAWTQVGSNVTNTAYTSGRMGIEFFDTCGVTAIEVRDLTTASTAPPRRRALLGVGI